jgi:hypothetical protein
MEFLYNALNISSYALIRTMLNNGTMLPSNINSNNSLL